MVANPKLSRQINRSLVLTCLTQNQPISRADISRITGLTPGTVSNIVSILIEEGLVLEDGVGEANRKGGKKPILLRLNPTVHYVIGLEVRSDYTQAGVVDLNYNIITSSRRPTSRFGVWSTPEQVVDGLVGFIDEVVSKSRIDKRRLAGVGLGIHGNMDARTGRVQFSPHFPFLEGVNIGSMLSERLGLPVITENDVRAESVAEKMLGLAQKADNVIAIHVDAGIGCAVFLKGELYKGTNGLAGEIGHVVMEQDGPKCECGNHGCLEAMAGGRAILKRVCSEIRRGIPSIITDRCGGDLDKITIELVVQAAVEGDELARRVMSRAGSYIGLALANVITLFDPELVVIHGEVARAREVLLEPIRIAVEQSSVPRKTARKTRIVIGEDKEDYAILGPALLALQNRHEKLEFTIANLPGSV